MTAFQKARRCVWFVTRPAVWGVQAIALTGEGKVVLVKHRYARGWHLPGGGRKRREDARKAVLRELREEIGLLEHGQVTHAGTFHHRPDFRKAIVSLFVVRGVRYRAPRTLEIEEVAEFDPASLPADTVRSARMRLSEHFPNN